MGSGVVVVVCWVSLCGLVLFVGNEVFLAQKGCLFRFNFGSSRLVGIGGCR
jgi:hypothetical protein